jgi:hypothetical protein
MNGAYPSLNLPPAKQGKLENTVSDLSRLSRAMLRAMILDLAFKI